MASGGGERRMVFDIRGRRRYAVKVVYAVLAVLMGASLFLVVGPLNVGELFNGGGGGTSEAAKQFEEQAQRLERKLKAEPDNTDLLVALTRTHINAGNSMAEIEPSGAKAFQPEALEQFQEASETWDEYLAKTKEPSANLAQVVAPTLFTMAELSRGNEIEANLKAAANAQRIVAEQRPNLNSLSTLGIYTMYTFDYKAAEKAGEEAKKYATTKFARENVDNQLKEIRKRAEEFQTRLVAYEKAVKKASKSGGGGAAALENPFGGLGG